MNKEELTLEFELNEENKKVLDFLKEEAGKVYWYRIENENGEHLDVVDKEKYDLLQQENKQLKELIDVILNWNIFNGECPMNFGYDKNTIEEKSQEVFYQDDDYCENNCNEDYKKCWLKYFRKMQELEKGNSNE